MNHTFQVCWFSQNPHNTQRSQLKLLELWKEALAKGKSVSAIFMDLSKAFGSLSYELLIAKIEAYGFSKLLRQSFTKNTYE